MPVPHRLRRAVCATLLVLLGGCTDEGAAPAERPPTDPGTPLASYDTRSVALERAPYCDRVPVSAVEEALGGPVRTSFHYDNGERVRFGAAGRDVAHEYGCRWSGRRFTASTWLFAPPVTVERARDLVALARRGAGCVPDVQAPRFGRPSVALLCAGGPQASASHRGLFGDAWLVCELAGPSHRRSVLPERVDRWCVAAAEAAAVGGQSP